MVDKIKDKWGNEIDLKQFENAGYGAFKEWVQENIDKDWGVENPKEIKKKKYVVNMSATATVSTCKKVVAETEYDAKKIAREELWSGDWSIDDVDDIECEVEEAEDED